jgi:hypothetical protein
MNLDQPIVYRNPTKKAARYAVIIADARSPRR